MKRFLIEYRLEQGTPEDWHREIARFISALDGDPVLAGRITYRCMRRGPGPAYVHLAETKDGEATEILQTRDYFKRYTAQTKLVSGGGVEVSPVESIAETARQA